MVVVVVCESWKCFLQTGIDKHEHILGAVLKAKNDKWVEKDVFRMWTNMCQLYSHKLYAIKQEKAEGNTCSTPFLLQKHAEEANVSSILS